MSDDEEEEISGKQKIKVAGYYDDKYRGLAEDKEFNNENDALDSAWRALQNGNFVEINGNRISPDILEEENAFEKLQELSGLNQNWNEVEDDE